MEIVRQAFDAYNRGDIVAAMKDADPEAELDFSRALGPYRGIYRLDQVRGFLDDFTGTFDTVQVEPTEYSVAGEDVVASLTIHFRGRDGSITRICIYQARQEALEAAGLSE